MDKRLDGKKIAILVADGFEQSELTGPKQALEESGAVTEIVSPAEGEVEGWRHYEKGQRFQVQKPLAQASADEYDALVLPGGVANPDQLRMMPEAVRFVKAFVDSGKPIAAICHGPWTLIEAGMVKGRKVTSWPSLKTDLVNAGAKWVDLEVVADSRLVTSRKPSDLPAFNRKMIEVFAEAVTERGRRMAAHEPLQLQPVPGRAKRPRKGLGRKAQTRFGASPTWRARKRQIEASRS